MSSAVYTVVRGDEPLKEFKRLAAAKKLADEMEADVYCGGQLVYTAKQGPEAQPQEQLQPYVLKARMNVRLEPNLSAEKQAVLEEGALVGVETIQDDWLQIPWKEGKAYILYEGGRYAERVRRAEQEENG